MKSLANALICLVLTAPIASQAQSVHDGLVNYWNFDGNNNDTAGSVPGNSSTVVDNGTFSGTNGTAGIGYAPGFIGQAILQNGAAAGFQNDGFVLIPRSADTLAGGESISMSAWFQVNAFDTNWQTLISHGEGSQYRIARQGAGSGIAYAGGNADHPNPSGTFVNDFLWHHVAATTENGGATTLYLDGAFYSANFTAAIINDAGNSNPNATPDLHIGSNPQTGANNREWNGSIDEVAQWNRMITETEVAQIYNAGRAGIPLSQVPEPATCLFAGVAGLLLGFRRLRRC